MSNELITKEKQSFFDKIKSFFKNLFSKKNTQTITTENKNENKSNVNLEFKKDLKADVSGVYNKEYKLKSFLKEIEENPNLVENISNDRLDQLIEYYEKITNSKREKIKKLKASLN